MSRYMRKAKRPGPAKDEKIAVTVMLPKVVKERLDELARETRRTRGGYIELALLAQFERDETKE
jgi:predicted transcriptional regulator